MPIDVLYNDSEVLIGLGGFKADVSDKNNLLRIIGALMRGSIARTFRDEGSPAHSWARLAASTLKKKGYSAGHKLLILSGRLFGSTSYSVSNTPLAGDAGTLIGNGSIKYEIGGGVLTIGTNLKYAAVHQWGSADRRGAAIGPQAKLADRAVTVGEHGSTRLQAFKRYGKREITDSKGRKRNVRVREAGPANATRFHVGEHQRHQNIPPRPYLVFRPEDPERFRIAIERYLGGKAVSIGRVGA
jgi:phage gpG-like protein